jgi:hypothetical protein
MVMADDINLNNPANTRRDAEERSAPTVIPLTPATGAGTCSDAPGNVTEPSGRGRSVATPPVVAPAMPEPAKASEDALAGCPGCHPVGTVTGAVAGAVAGGAAAAAVTGMALGSLVGPFGTAVGAAIGATVGGLAGGYTGQSVAESINPSTEDAYWRSNFATRPYVAPGCSFEDYREAYAFGVRTRQEFSAACFDEVEAELKARWMAGSHKLPWSKACPAVCDAWDRLSPKDADL